MNQFELTTSILEYRKETDAFKQSITTRSDKMQWKFYDGPPFTSGDPHYGHLLQSTVKDMVPRWMTMRGYSVERKRGWDCHGIPAENFVNKKLGITSKKQVEQEFGLQNYIEECRSMVGDVNTHWKRFIDHLGRWVDMNNAYFTMNNDFMESVIHLFADLYHNNMIYKGFKVLGYSRALGTALSNSEIAEGYMDRQDPAVTVKLKLKDTPRDVVMGVMKHEDKIFMVYDTRTGRWFFPGGKIEDGENHEQALTREIKEEVGVDIVPKKNLGSILGVSHGEVRRLHHHEVDYTGEFVNHEPVKQGVLARVSTIEFDNDLGFAIKVEPIGDGESAIIDEVYHIEHDFATFLTLKNKQYELPGVADASISLLAWTTTPWTLPSNMFGAVNNEVIYSMLYDLDEKEYFVIAKELVSKFYKEGDNFVVVRELQGRHFVGLSYQALFDYYYTSEHIDPSYHNQVHKILHADFVTEESGTGIAHEAPAFGEDDYNLVMTILPPEQARDRLFNPVNDHGEFTEEVADFSGMNVIESNKEVIKKLKENDLLVKQETINHSYPHCPRTKEPIIYRAMESRFVKEKELTAKTLPLADQINFVPNEIKKRFTNGLASAPDWNISRSRFRGAPLPVWECEDEECEERKVFGSIDEIAKASGQEVNDLHRPYIDQITVPCTCGKTMNRIPEVLDCWFESGSMPFAQDHWMKNADKEGPEDFSSTADFIAEGLDQTRGWFRALHVLGTAYTDNIVYKNVVITGMILAEDGKKMSKSLKNYPDPKGLLERYGSDAFRLYVLSSPVVRAEPLRFAEHGVEQVLKDFVIPIQNVWNFFKTYASVDDWKHEGNEIYFMRHADKIEDGDLKIENRDAQLSENGFKQLSSQTFIEKVIRVNPDVIITTNRLRAIQTANGAKEVISNYLGKEIEVIERDNLVDGFNEKTCSKIYQDLVQEFSGKRVLIVSHRWRFLYLWNELFGVSNKHGSKEYQLLSTQIVKLPTVKIHNELDQRILSELYTMMDELDGHLQGYDLEPATKVLMGFMDKLTNRWLRRSRRRFWAQGLDDDKHAVYWTLREVLSIYLKLAAPFAPFVSEWVRQEMKQFGQVDGSIHLEYRPLGGEKYINKELSQEISQVRKIIKGAMYLRAKHQIKVKQPLKELKFGF